MCKKLYLYFVGHFSSQPEAPVNGKNEAAKERERERERESYSIEEDTSDGALL